MKLLSLLFLIVCTSCVHRIGDFTLVTTRNVDLSRMDEYERHNVKITGEVRFPGVYTLRSPVERISDVVARAGGLKGTAYPDGFALVREKDEIGRIALNLQEALDKPGSQDNMILFAGDSLFVPEEPRTVTVRGEVGYPTALLYTPGLSISDYIDQAGGTTNNADKMAPIDKPPRSAPQTLPTCSSVKPSIKAAVGAIAGTAGQASPPRSRRMLPA